MGGDGGGTFGSFGPPSGSAAVNLCLHLDVTPHRYGIEALHVSMLVSCCACRACPPMRSAELNSRRWLG